VVISHVLVVEPKTDPEIERALRDRRLDVQFARDAREALELVHAFMPAVIILDMLVPELDAWHLISKVRELAADRSETPLPALILLTDRPGAWQSADFGSVRLSDRKHLMETFEDTLRSLEGSRHEPDLVDAAAWDATVAAVRAKGDARFQAETERMRRLDIIDDRDQAKRQERPADMKPGSRTDVAT